MLRSTCLALLLPVAASAQSYDANPALVAFRDRPCTEVMDVIYTEEASGTSLQDIIATTNRVNFYLGFLVGYDTAHGGLDDENGSSLARLREACTAQPSATALELLERFAAEKAE